MERTAERVREGRDMEAEKIVDVKEVLSNAMEVVRRVGAGKAQSEKEIEIFPEVLKIIANMSYLGDGYYMR
jgi:hypothetical protein